MLLSEKIRRLVKEKDVTLVSIAKTVGVTERTVQNYAKGRTVPKTYEKYLTLCEQVDKLYKTAPERTSKYDKWYKSIRRR